MSGEEDKLNEAKAMRKKNRTKEKKKKKRDIVEYISEILSETSDWV